ncbi:hypothetical protein KIW84_056528 [Lathyrus oleraceus]|uniref:Uncharacterized protein n=1 Tax=Pisum sativum TaxID=3888 RepID=A0A9D4X1Q2_PEA|nr:hypothetical protein KIW84_056528 [Pisum sativum]
MSTALERFIIMAYMDYKTFPQTNINDMLPKNPLYVGNSDSMDSNNWIPDQGSEPTLDTIDWRTQLDPESSQRIVNKIMDTLKKTSSSFWDVGITRTSEDCSKDNNILILFNFKHSSPRIRSSSADTVITELDVVSAFIQIVPDTIIFDDFQKFPPTAATVSSSLILGICGLQDTIFRNAVEMALADSQCYGLEIPNERLSCFATKDLVNVGSDMAKLVPGRVSTEVDARLAYDTHGIIWKVHDLLKLYNDSNVPHEPAAQVGASVIQIFVGRVRDWARTHSDDEEIEAAQLRGEDPGLALITKAYNYIYKYGHKSKLMAATVHNSRTFCNQTSIIPLNNRSNNVQQSTQSRLQQRSQIIRQQLQQNSIPQQQQQHQASEDEKYTQWKSLAPILYNGLANRNLTDDSVPNTLVIANCEVMKTRVAAAEHIPQFNEEAHSPFVKKYKTIIQPGEVNRIRELP